MSKQRTINIDGRIWRWKVGRNNVVARAQDNDEKRVVDFSKLTGLDWYSIERGQWKGGFKITPGMVADWLQGIPANTDRMFCR